MSSEPIQTSTDPVDGADTWYDLEINPESDPATATPDPIARRRRVVFKVAVASSLISAAMLATMAVIVIRSPNDQAFPPALPASLAVAGSDPAPSPPEAAAPLPAAAPPLPEPAAEIEPKAVAPVETAKAEERPASEPRKSRKSSRSSSRDRAPVARTSATPSKSSKSKTSKPAEPPPPAAPVKPAPAPTPPARFGHF